MDYSKMKKAQLIEEVEALQAKIAELEGTQAEGKRAGSENQLVTQPTVYQSPVRLVIIVAVSVFVSEVLVMIIISLLQPFPILFEVLFDSAFLVVLLSPMLYFFSFRPLVLHIVERKRAEEALRELTHNLGERVKELNCLYGISALVEKPGVSLEEILQGTVGLIPPAWQYPEVTCARIILEGQEFTTQDLRETIWRQDSDIIVHGQQIGTVEVCYLEERPASDEGPFLKEERNLVNAIAEQLGRIIERVRVEEALRKAHNELEIRVQERTAELARSNEELQVEITERKCTEESLRESEQRYRTLVDLAPEIIYLLDPDGKIVFINRSVEALGYAPDELIGRRFEEIAHPDDIEKAGGTLVERRIGERATRDLEVRLLTKHGEVRDHATRSVEAAVSVRGLWDVPNDQIKQPQKTFLGTLGIARDITERKQAEEALQKAHDELERRVEKRTDELSKVNEELMALNAIATTLSLSLDLDRILKATLDKVLEVIQIDAGWIQLLDEDKDGGPLVAHRGLSQKMIEVARTMKLGESMTVQVARSGQPIVLDKVSDDLWFSIETDTWETLHSFAGVSIESKDKVLGMLGVFSHFPRRLSSWEVQLLTAIGHQIGVAIENARLVEEAAEIEILQELNRLRSELIANVSHELRTPLGLIKVFCTSLLREDVDFDRETQREFLHDIDEEADKLEKIVDNLLDLSRLESGRLRLDKRPTGLGQLAGEVMESMETQLTQLRLIHDFPADPLVAMVDAKRIEQVLRNLLSNAVKYSPEEGGSITVQGRGVERQLLVSVSDQGIGIPSEDLERVFERFYRVENEITQSTRGAGLGLAVCQGIVEAHGGRIWVESTLGEGSTFYFTLPAES